MDGRPFGCAELPKAGDLLRLLLRAVLPSAHPHRESERGGEKERYKRSKIHAAARCMSQDGRVSIPQTCSSSGSTFSMAGHFQMFIFIMIVQETGCTRIVFFKAEKVESRFLKVALRLDSPALKAGILTHVSGSPPSSCILSARQP